MSDFDFQQFSITVDPRNDILDCLANDHDWFTSDPGDRESYHEITCRRCSRRELHTPGGCEVLNPGATSFQSNLHGKKTQKLYLVIPSDGVLGLNIPLGLVSMGSGEKDFRYQGNTLIEIGTAHHALTKDFVWSVRGVRRKDIENLLNQ